MLDTNVLISALLFGGAPGDVVAAAQSGRFDVISSRELLDEFAGVLIVKFGFTEELARAARGEVERVAEEVAPPVLPRTSRDPDDDVVLAAALAGGADVIVTGDQDLLSLDSFRGIRVMDPSTFLAELAH